MQDFKTNIMLLNDIKYLTATVISPNNKTIFRNPNEHSKCKKK